MTTADFPTLEQFRNTLAQTADEYGLQAVTGELVTMYNRLRTAKVEGTELYFYVDERLELVSGQWDMDRAGYLYMV